MNRDLEAVCEKALCHDRGHRYTNVEEFRSDLQRWLSRGAVKARTNTAYRVRKWLRARKLVVMALGLVFLCALVGMQWARGRDLTQSYQTTMTMAAFLKIASTERDLDRVESAVSLLEKAIAVGEGATDPGATQLLFESYQRLADLLLSQGELERSEEYCSMALDLADKLRSTSADDLQFIRIYGAALRLMGRLEAKKENWEGALPFLEHGTQVRRELVHRLPENTTVQRELASIRSLQGRCLRKLNRFAEAKQCYAEELRIHRELHHKQTTVANTVSLAFAHLHMAVWYMEEDNSQREASSAREHLLASRDLVSDEEVATHRPRDARRILEAVSSNLSLLD